MFACPVYCALDPALSAYPDLKWLKVLRQVRGHARMGDDAEKVFAHCHGPRFAIRVGLLPQKDQPGRCHSLPQCRRTVGREKPPRQCLQDRDAQTSVGLEEWCEQLPRPPRWTRGDAPLAAALDGLVDM